ncbi:MAG: nuclear transport factor 2 family protein [Opitutus sp.]|nr:nuclear transport factor 2 family protein [Opitutus sp.]
MKSRLRLLPLFALTLLSASLRAATDPAAAWRAADDARVAAMISADPAKLATTFSDDLLYVHSNGKPDTKASLSAAIASGSTKYNAINYEQREFRELVPGLVHMTGRANVLLGKTAPFNELHLSFLAAYRLEKGVWRFIAWQSCKLPEPTAAKKN